MKKSIFSCIFLFSCLCSVFAQTNESMPSVVLCENYNEQGAVTGVFNSWTIDSLGGSVYVVYSQQEPITAKAIYLQVEYLSSSTLEYETEKTITLTPEKGKNWLVYDYFFTKDASYMVSIIMDGLTLATNYEEFYFETRNASDTITTFYYENSYVGFCEKVVDGQMIGESAEFPASPSGTTEVAVYVHNDGPFLTDFFYVDVYEDDVNIDSYEVDVVSTWNYTHFLQKFDHPGTYEIDIYSGDDVYINTGEIIIK